MSQYSGRCDLYDHIFSGCEGWKDYFDRFYEFKRKTGGKLYQERKVRVSEFNLDDICEMNHELGYSETAVTKRGRNGAPKEATEKRFTYWGKEYDSLAKLNKKGVYVRIEIPFETVLDLIPYYPYVIGCNYWSDDKEIVIVARQSEPDSEIEDWLASGFFVKESIEFEWQYKHELAEHYREVLEELNRDMRLRHRQIDLGAVPMIKEGEWYLLRTEDEIDVNQPIKWFFPDKPVLHWASARYRDAHTIAISDKDVEDYLKDAIANHAVCIRYVRRKDYERHDGKH